MEVVTKLVTPPTEYPVTLNDVRDHARITETVDDARISTVFIPAATEYAEAYLKRQLCSAIWRLTLPRFPMGFGIIELPNPSLILITGITYVDSAGATQALTPSDYQVDTESEPGRVAPARGESWPEPDSETLNAVTVNYQAGYGAASAVPVHIKLAILVLCTHWYDRRGIDAPGAIMGNVKHSLDALLAKERIEPPNYEDC